MRKINPGEFLAKISKKINFPQALLTIEQFTTQIIQDRNKLILAVLVIVVGLYLDFSFILGTQRRALRVINPKIVRLREDLKDLNLDLTRIQSQGDGSVGAQEKKLASPDQISWLIEEISRLANQQKVNIFKIQPLRELSSARISKSSRKSLPSEQYSSILIGLEVSAGYHQLARFIAELEDHSLVLEVTGLDIKHSDEDAFEHKVKLTLKAYVSK